MRRAWMTDVKLWRDLVVVTRTGVCWTRANCPAPDVHHFRPTLAVRFQILFNYVPLGGAVHCVAHLRGTL